jgi:two-component system heavy metal sensor histidine kinase CusS
MLIASLTFLAVDRHFSYEDKRHIEHKFETVKQIHASSNFQFIESVNTFSVYAWLVDQDEVLARNSTVALPKKIFNVLKENPEDSYEWTDNDENYRAFIFTTGPGKWLILALKTDHHLKFFSELKILGAVFFFIGLFLTSVCTLVGVKKGLQPIDRLREYFKKVAPENLDIRVPDQDIPIELAGLVESMNLMLQRLEDGFEQLMNFSSDIAHELRTPIANIKTQSSVILSQDRSEEEYREVLVSNLEELARITKMINDLLYIARAENSLIHKDDQVLSLKQELTRIVEYYQILAEEKDVEIQYDGEASLCIDKGMLEKAINNLLVNAVRHAEKKSVVKVVVQDGDDKVSLSVSNQGEDIPVESLDKIFDRFYRVDKSRQYEHSVGAGLGLAITKSIIEAYNGDVIVTSTDGLTTFQVSFPKT